MQRGRVFRPKGASRFLTDVACLLVEIPATTSPDSQVKSSYSLGCIHHVASFRSAIVAACALTPPAGYPPAIPSAGYELGEARCDAGTDRCGHCVRGIRVAHLAIP